jgi:extracellular factor (EF) 3-hydroxypalmitic acid methyl ester biosynthesis protein
LTSLGDLFTNDVSFPLFLIGQFTVPLVWRIGNETEATAAQKFLDAFFLRLLSVLTSRSGPPMTAVIHPEFKKHFDELEALHLDLHGRLTHWTYEGAELLTQLTKERQAFTPVRFCLMDRLAEIALPFRRKVRAEHQAYIRQTKYYMIVQEAPFYWRIINKPEGYAGDAEMMNLIYRDQYEGETPFGMLIHRDAVATDACQAVRNRRTFLLEWILRKGRGRGPRKILSIGAGPAMEIRDILIHNSFGNKYQCDAFDHDIKTIRKNYQNYTDSRLQYVLGNAFHLIKGSYRVAVPRKALLGVCEPERDFQGWWKALAPIKYAFTTLKKEDYDLVYTAGLYDYIATFPDQPEKGTIALTKNLFALVKPGGSLIIGNFSLNNPRDLRFVMEYIYDWQLIHRNEEEMFRLAQAIQEREIASITIEQEPLGINYFLVIRKK